DRVMKGVGPAKSKAIIDYRNAKGSFKTVDDLKKVPGIGDKTLEENRANLTVGGGTSKTPAASPPPASPAAASKPVPVSPVPAPAPVMAKPKAPALPAATSAPAPAKPVGQVK
ncbi:MAG: helix-hairpin-helix domain-containing protein, partial [Pseudomonadota bacterium]